jgi:hypothetical protein
MASGREQFRQAGIDPVGDLVRYDGALPGQFDHARVEGGEHRGRVGTSVEAEPPEPQVAPLARNEPCGAIGDIAEEHPRLARGQEFVQRGAKLRETATGQSPAVTLNDRLQRLQCRQGKQAPFADPQVLAHAAAHGLGRFGGVMVGDQVALVEHEEQPTRVPGGVSQETGLGLGQRRVEAGYEDHRVSLGEELPGGRGIDLDGRPDSGSVHELESQPQDLRRNLDLDRRHLQLGAPGAGLRDVTGHLGQRHLDGQGRRLAAHDRAGPAAEPDRGDHRGHRQRPHRQVGPSEQRVHQRGLAPAELAHNRELEPVGGQPRQ